MKKSTLSLVLAFASITLFISSCSKSTTTIPNTTTGGLTWIENTATTVTADSAYFDTRYSTLHAFKGGTAKIIELNLSAGTVGTYTVSSANSISYIASGSSTTYIATTGSVNITANASAKMTGSFSSTGTGASLTSLSGTFIDIPVR